MKMRGPAIIAFLVMGVAFQGCTTQKPASEPRTDPLKPLTRCEFADGLRVVAVDRLEAGVKSRKVITAGGWKSVSVADGYRVMLAYPDTDYFANLKIERSETSGYSEDKTIILENVRYLSEQSSIESGVRVALEHSEYHGFDLYAVSWPTIDFYIPDNPPGLGGGPIGTYVLFRDSTRTIFTVYFVNQRPAQRKFKTLEEYKVLRDRFLERYVSCVNKSLS